MVLGFGCSEPAHMLQSVPKGALRIAPSGGSWNDWSYHLPRGALWCLLYDWLGAGPQHAPSGPEPLLPSGQVLLRDRHQEESCFSQALLLRLSLSKVPASLTPGLMLMVHELNKTWDLLCLRRNDNILSVGVEL